MDPLSEKRLSLVHPRLAQLVREMHVQLVKENIPIMVAVGLRAWSDQMKAWLKGRDENGNVVDQKQIVTNAPPGHSWHEYGLAVDVVPIAFVLLPNWGVGKPQWDRIVTTGESLGLFSGSRFVHAPKDWPHFQLTGALSVSPSDEIRQLFHDSGMAAVWAKTGLPMPPAVINNSVKITV